MAEITFRMVVIISSVVKITVVAVFQEAVITSSVAKITL